MQFTKTQKEQLNKQAYCLYMDLEDTPISCESWQCLKKPQVWSILEIKRVYDKRKTLHSIPEFSTVMLAMDSGWGHFAIFENNKLLCIETKSDFTTQIKVRDKDVLIINKEYQNTEKCIWV